MHIALAVGLTTDKEAAEVLLRTRFIPNFSLVAGPLTVLTTKKHSRMVKWAPKAEEVFVKVSEAGPWFRKEFVVQADASQVGLSAVLAQSTEGEEHPVLYLIRKLLPREKNYALETLKYYLLGRRFTLVTDHSPLQQMAKNKESNSRITRWFQSLQPFNFSVVHRPRRCRGNADALSCWDAFWASFSLQRTSGLGRGMCGISRLQVIKGCHMPDKRLPPTLHFPEDLTPLTGAGV